MTYKAYTLNLGRCPQSVISDIWVDYPLNPDTVLMPDDAVKCRGKWDTGCNMTCISPTVANSLCLPPGRHIEVKTPHGTTTSTNTVFVSLKIPNGQILPSVEVCIAHMVDADMLIGMDVISLGDFALTRNKYGEMIMSICMPPMMTVDFNPVAAEVNNGRL